MLTDVMIGHNFNNIGCKTSLIHKTRTSLSDHIGQPNDLFAIRR